MLYIDIIAVCWFVFLVFWIISSVKVKRDINRHGSLWVSVGARLLIALAIISILRLPLVRHVMQEYIYKFTLAHPAIETVGTVLCVIGVAFAIWARANLGANWSERPATKEEHELITSGPYRLVRHPIYFGMLLALLGTALVSGVPGLLALIGFGITLIHRIRVEERLMTQLFPGKYPEYKRRTKCLIPYVV